MKGHLAYSVTCAVVNYRRLDQTAMENLKSVTMETDEVNIKKFHEALGLNVDGVAFVRKCNAMMVFVAYRDDLSQEYVNGRILATWDSLSHGGITSLIRDIRFYYDEEALRFIAECAVGIHSVTTGDSQVLSQVEDGLRNSFPNTSNPFPQIANWVKEVAGECRIKTDIFKGNVSLERTACQMLLEKLPKDTQVVLLGYGKTGKLVAKILNTENDIPLTIVNRSSVNTEEEGFGKDVHYVTSYEHITVIADGAVVIITLENNPQTLHLVRKLIETKGKGDTFYIDLSSPSLLRDIKFNGHFIDLETISQRASQIEETRKSEINKARTIIEKLVDPLIKKINSESAKLYLEGQKNTKVKLSSADMRLIKMRAHMFKKARSYLETRKFIEIITPYIVGISTDPPRVDKGGTIDVEWFNGARSFLRQSNQIYKQIYAAGGVAKLYEIGPFWRKETEESYRHLQESIGLDVEIQNPTGLQQLYLLACSIIREVNNSLVKEFKTKDNLQIPSVNRIPVLTYDSAVELLRENGNPITRGDDFGVVSEAKLGQLVYKKYGSKIFVIKDYPDTIKKFYTKRKNSGLTETFDVIVDGWEIVSGAIRQTNGQEIRKSMKLSSINTSDYEFYINLINGTTPHGGFCIGLDRLLAKILDKEMVSEAVPFPRTYRKLIP